MRNYTINNNNKISPLMNKKGILLKTVLGLIIGLLCVIILATLAIGMYNLFIKPGIDEQAKATFNEIVNNIKGLEEGDEIKYTYLNPVDWVLIFKNRKLCFCSADSISEFSERGDKTDEKFNLCFQKKLCQNFAFDVSINSLCTFDAAYAQSCLRFNSGFKKLVFTKENGIVNIKTAENFQNEKELNIILNLKNSNGKTVEELLLEPDILKANPSVNTPSREELKTIITDYFENYDSVTNWNVNKEDFYFLFRLEIQGENIGGSLLYIGDDGGPTISTSDKRFKADGKDYLITLKYYNDPNRALGNLNI